MANLEKITIKFTPEGDKQLINAIKHLDIVTKKLKGTTSVYEKELKKLSSSQARNNKLTLFGVKNQRLLGNTFATVRSKLLLYSFAVGLTTKAFKELFEKSIEQEKAEKKLEVALGRTSTALLNQASALQQVTTFGDESIIGVQALIASFTDDEEAIKKATKATLDLAAAKGMDLSSAADLVSKTLGSSTNSLSRYGIKVEGAVGSTRRLDSLTGNIAKLFGGQAKASAETLGGAIEQMSNAFGDANEAVGQAFAPTIKTLAEFFKGTAESAKEFFLTFSETPMEKTVRLIEEAGGNADNLRLSLLNAEKLELDKKFKQMPEGLNTSSEVLDKIAGQEEVRIGRLRKLFNMQTSLNNKSLDENKLRAFTSESYKKAIDNLKELLKHQKEHGQTLEFESDFYQDFQEFDATNIENQIKIMENNRKMAEFYLPILQHNKDQVDLSDEQIEQNKVILEFLLEYEILLAKIKALEGEGDGTLGIDLDKVQGITSEVNVYIKALGQIATAYQNMEMQAINQEKATKLAAAESIRSERKRQKEIDKINKKARQEERQVKKQVQKVRILEAISNTAVAVTEALPNIPLATLIGIAGALQVETIRAQKFERGGMVGGRRHSQGGTLIEAERGEFVMSRSAVESVGLETMNRINEGGGSGISISFSGNVMSDEFIESEAIPKIKEAIRRGADIGVS